MILGRKHVHLSQKPAQESKPNQLLLQSGPQEETAQQRPSLHLPVCAHGMAGYHCSDRTLLLCFPQQAPHMLLQLPLTKTCIPFLQNYISLYKSGRRSQAWYWQFSARSGWKTSIFLGWQSFSIGLPYLTQLNWLVLIWSHRYLLKALTLSAENFCVG